MKQHEAIALRKGEVGRNKSCLTGIYQAFQKAVIYAGFVKSYEPVDVDGEHLPSETKRVQRSVEGDLVNAKTSLLKLWNIVGSVELGNGTAKGDIVVNGDTILEGVPVTTLLFLETQLTDLRTTLGAIPTLSPDFEWAQDDNDGLFKTDVVKTHRNVKHTRPIVLYDATDKHPAQTQLIEEPKLAGYWNAVQHSGACPTVKKVVLVNRVEQLLDAVKAARARANGSTTPGVSMAPVLDFIFA